MGTDIHLFVEYRDPQGQWMGLSEGEIAIGREGGLFDMLSGIYGGTSQIVITPHRLTDDLSFDTMCQYCLYVSTETDWDKNIVKLEDAEALVDKERSRWYNFYNIPKRHIVHPDWHHPGWLTTNEFELVVNRFEDECYPWPLLHAILAAMRVFDPGSEGKARVVFWYDS